MAKLQVIGDTIEYNGVVVAELKPGVPTNIMEDFLHQIGGARNYRLRYVSPRHSGRLA